MAERLELLACRAVAQLRLVAQGEQRLVAARLGAGAGDGEDLVAGQIDPLAAARRLGEGAVVTDVAAQLGERDEDLARIRHQPAMPDVAQRGGHPHQRR